VCYYDCVMAQQNFWKNKFLFDPTKEEPHKISRSKIDLFIECPRCFYLDQRLGIRRPSMPGFTLNVAVDELLKKEFDMYRAKNTPHPIMVQYKIDAVPYANDELEAWRDSLRRGITHHHKPTNLIIRGGVDDVWIDKNGNLIIVDYKATSKKDEPTIETGWGDQYKRQMEIYQWLFRQNGFPVLPTGYFVYCNGKKDKESFNAKLEFDIIVISYTGSDSWVEKTLITIKACLMDDRIPSPLATCEYCAYREKAYNSEHSELSENFSKKPRENQSKLF